MEDFIPTSSDLGVQTFNTSVSSDLCGKNGVGGKSPLDHTDELISVSADPVHTSGECCLGEARGECDLGECDLGE